MATSALALYAPVGLLWSTGQALPWCPHPLRGYPAVPACHPCYPGGPRMTRQRWWAPEHRSSSPDNGVDALAELTGLHLGSLHATACGVARSPRRALVRELGASGYPWHLPQATRVRCPLPGPDFHRRVPWYPRHTVRYLFSGSRRSRWNVPSGTPSKRNRPLLSVLVAVVRRGELRVTAIPRPGVAPSGMRARPLTAPGEQRPPDSA